MTKSEIMKMAHANAKAAMAEQREVKHPSAHKTYRQLLAIALRGCYVLAYPVPAIERAPQFMFLRGL